MLLMLFVFLSE